MESAEKANHYSVVQAPILWAQDLFHVYIEIRLAHRHDAPGCANHTEPTISLTPQRLDFSVTCLSDFTKVNYNVNLNFWGDGISEKYSQSTDFEKYVETHANIYEYQSVGKYRFKLEKMNSPTRWRHLYAENTPKSLTQNIKLDLDKMEHHAKGLYEFDGDDIDDFEGVTILEEYMEEEEERDRKKDLPKKGPIPLKNKKKKKKSKRT